MFFGGVEKILVDFGALWLIVGVMLASWSIRRHKKSPMDPKWPPRRDFDDGGPQTKFNFRPCKAYFFVLDGMLAVFVWRLFPYTLVERFWW